MRLRCNGLAASPREERSSFGTSFVARLPAQCQESKFPTIRPPQRLGPLLPRLVEWASKWAGGRHLAAALKRDVNRLPAFAVVKRCAAHVDHHKPAIGRH